MAGKGNRKWFLIGLVLVVTAGLLLAVNDLVIELKEKQTAKQWLKKAEKSADSTTTFNDTYQWLVDNEFEVIVWKPHKDQGWISSESLITKYSKTTYYIVQGSKLLTEKSFLSDASWIDLKFKFDLEHNFQNIGFIIRRYPLPNGVTTVSAEPSPTCA